MSAAVSSGLLTKSLFDSTKELIASSRLDKTFVGAVKYHVLARGCAAVACVVLLIEALVRGLFALGYAIAASCSLTERINYFKEGVKFALAMKVSMQCFVAVFSPSVLVEPVVPIPNPAPQPIAVAARPAGPPARRPAPLMPAQRDNYREITDEELAGLYERNR